MLNIAWIIASLVIALDAWPILGLLFSLPSLTMASSINSTSRIVELASQISISVHQLQKQLSAQGSPTPSFADGSSEGLPANVSHLKDAILDATAELHELLLDPLLLLFKFASVSIRFLSSEVQTDSADRKPGQHRCSLPLPYPRDGPTWRSNLLRCDCAKGRPREARRQTAASTRHGYAHLARTRTGNGCTYQHLQILDQSRHRQLGRV